MSGILIGERCPYCQKFRSPASMLRQTDDVVICDECQQRHLNALELLSGGQVHGSCSECGRKWDLERDSGIAVHFEAGRYRMVCRECDLKYTPKRMELYGNTEFGRAIGN